MSQSSFDSGASSSASTRKRKPTPRPQDEPTVSLTHAGAPSQPTVDAYETSETQIVPLQQGQLIQQRYEIRNKLGRGGFGSVYSAHDRSLNRLVAIKQSTGLRSFFHGQVRDEARAVASLNHPNIVQIHDLIQVNPHELLIVMECLDGVPLSGRMRRSRIPLADAVRIGAEVASALIHAHEKQLVHSDLKPANLFLCNNGSVKLLDFGLAVAYFPDTSAEYIGGTPGYMSPEQVRGESHLIDGRTDIWAFGVVMYELLTGTRPYPKEKRRRFQEQMLIETVAPPRQLNPEIDAELQRIVLKCLQPLISLRYASAADLRADLLAWLDSQGEATGLTSHGGRQQESFPNLADASSLRLGKRGLQPFTERDASSYLPLIPGARDRNGVPDSIRFWKRWAESDDAETDHPVGVLYGPSGSGKTSYVRAGLLRQLSPDVCCVYVECRAGDLGDRLTRIIASRLQSGHGESSLRDLLLRFRSGDSGSRGFHKLLIVLDQFEAWSHSATREERASFAEALRQCDGVQIRALVVTRDDYWPGVKELMHWLEIPLQEGRNVASIDLLDRSHAERILEAMGREAGTLPPDEEPLTSGQQQFIQQSVNELAVDGAVVCVHLVMFAQMVRLQSWTPRALQDSGGVAGACSLFLEELFERSSRHSPEYHRVAPAAAIVLAKLVPPADCTVNELSVGVNELKTAVAEARHARLFDDCMRVLSEDVRIVSAVSTDPTDFDGDDLGHDMGDRFRLAHDFLVEPVNSFLARTQNRSWRGRTQSRLSELSDTWSRRQIDSHLPSFTDYLGLMAGSLLHRRSEKEARFLRAATKMHGGRISVAVVALIAFLLMTVVALSQRKSAQDARHRALVANIDLLLNGPANEFPTQQKTLQEFGADATVELAAWSDSVDPNLRLRSQIYLQSVQPQSFAPIASMLAQAPAALFQPILQVAANTDDAETVLQAASADMADAVSANRAAILLAYLGDDAALRARLGGSIDADVDQAFVFESTQWRGQPQLWADLVRGDTNDPAVRYRAATVLGGYPASELQAAGIEFDFDALINSPQATVHSVGRYLANHMGEDVFAIPLDPPNGADWRVGPDDLPMVRLEAVTFEFQPPTPAAAAKPREKYVVAVDRPFWMATTPVSRRLYAEFVASAATADEQTARQVSLERFKLPSYLTDDDNQPMIGTSLAQAYQFCNWLSRREGLGECYQPKEVVPVVAERSRITPREIPWEFDASANGFRVPTQDEFRLAALCRYERGLGWQHAIDIANSGGFTANTNFTKPLFELMPSRYGLFVFDVHAGTWISGSSRFTEQAAGPVGIINGVMTVPLALPGTCIFLAQNAGER